MTQNFSPSNTKKLKKSFILFSFLLFILALGLTVKEIQHRKKKTNSSLNLDSFVATLPSAEFTTTDRSKFGDDGVHVFKNLYYHSQQFLIAQQDSLLQDTSLNFLGNGEYTYKIRPFTEAKFNKYSKRDIGHKIPGTTLIMASSNEMKNLQHHYFHFLEEFVLAWAAYRDSSGKPVSTVIFPDIDHWKGVNEINFQILQALIPDVTVLNKEQFQELTAKNLIQFENAVLVDRQGCHNLPPVATYNKMVLGHAHLIKNEYLNEIRDSVLTSLKTSEKPNRQPTITYINRKNRRYLESEFEKKFLQTLRKEFPNHKVQAIWFEKLNYAGQMQVIRNTDILIGAHGNGLTHSYFLPDNALVLEIFPEGAFAMDYQLISELSGHNYYAIEPKDGIISFSGHHMKPRGNVNQVIPEFDMKWIVSPIKDHLQRLEEAGGEKEISPGA